MHTERWLPFGLSDPRSLLRLFKLTISFPNRSSPSRMTRNTKAYMNSDFAAFTGASHVGRRITVYTWSVCRTFAVGHLDLLGGLSSVPLKSKSVMDSKNSLAFQDGRVRCRPQYQPLVFVGIVYTASLCLVIPTLRLVIESGHTHAFDGSLCW